jgi:hypothetical protein
MKNTHTFPGTDTKPHQGHNIKKDKLYYIINILLIRAVYGPILENTALRTALDIRPLLAIMLHKGTKNNTLSRKSNIP